MLETDQIVIVEADFILLLDKEDIVPILQGTAVLIDKVRRCLHADVCSMDSECAKLEINIRGCYWCHTYFREPKLDEVLIWEEQDANSL